MDKIVLADCNDEFAVLIIRRGPPVNAGWQ